jgi:hypothetical protein
MEAPPVLYKIFGGLVALVAVVALISGPQSAATIAGKGLATIGITAGAIVGGAGSLIEGFNLAKGASQAPAAVPQQQRRGATTP